MASTEAYPTGERITTDTLKRALAGRSLHYDKGGDELFNAISALHKAVRGSDPDAALYWTARMLEGGEDPKYVVRRFIRMASEDIGLADPWALVHATAAKDAVEFLGMPECNNALAQLAIYLACAPKSNAVYTAYKNTQKVVQQHGALPAPLNIRNAPTSLMKELGYGENYTYAHNYPGGFTPDNYWPERLAKSPPRLLHLKGLGAEKILAERLRHWWGDRFVEEGKRNDQSQSDERRGGASVSACGSASMASTEAYPTGKIGKHRGLPHRTAETKRETPELETYSRRLPHWRLTGSAYFITWRLQEGVALLTPEERGIVVSAIRHFKDKRYELYAYVVMDDHVHVALRPLTGFELHKITHSWKSFTAKQLQDTTGRVGQVWQHESWDRIIREEEELIEKCEYILNNPLKRWPDLKDYQWVGWE